MVAPRMAVAPMASPPSALRAQYASAASDARLAKADPMPTPARSRPGEDDGWILGIRRAALFLGFIADHLEAADESRTNGEGALMTLVRQATLVPGEIDQWNQLATG